MRGAKILYVTVDGVLEPLGYSQVCRVLFGLSKRGFQYHLLSLESPTALADTARVRRLNSELDDHGIAWTHHAYDQGGSARSAATNLLQIGRSMRTLLASGAFGLVHARAYHSALLAAVAKRLANVPYLFDARGRWVDERLAGGRWFNRPGVEVAARAFERHLYLHASAVVVLTQLHADDIVAGDFGRYNGKPIRVITTCADFEIFRLETRFERDTRTTSAIPAPLVAQLAGKLVLGFIGSTNASYRHTDAFALAKQIMARRADAQLVILSSQQQEFALLAERAGLPPERVTITTTSHRAMPEWLSRIDWAIQLLNTGSAKRGSMPTKLAEFFAAGVRPLHFGCNSEVTNWVDHAGSGYVLKSLDHAELVAAANFVATATPDRQLLERARISARGHFDLASGLNAYAELLPLVQSIS